MNRAYHAKVKVILNLKKNGKIMVTVKKFSATWCGPCKVLAPIINEVKGQFPNVNFIDYDIDEAYSEATQYGIRSVPTVIIEKNGVEVERFTGTSSKMAYVNAINECIN
jgi:thioredoxin 1